MMTERNAFNQQTNVEQSALFPTSSADTEEHVVIEIPDRDTTFYPGSDNAPSFDTDGLTTEERSEFLEAQVVVQNIAAETVYANQYIDSDSNAGQQERLASDFADSVEYLSKNFDGRRRAKLAQAAVNALQEMPQSDIAKRLIADNRTVSQVARQRSVELQSARDETVAIETSLRSRKIQLVIQLGSLPDSSELRSGLVSEIAFLDSILEREKIAPKIVDFGDTPTPSTDELEAQFALASEEALSPARGTAIGRLAHRVIDSTVELVHKAKSVITLDETLLDKAHSDHIANTRTLPVIR